MQLKRSLSLMLVTFYGLGTILGAGIYALIGQVAQNAKEYTPLAFLIASTIALFTAISYAELCSRFPQTAGSALYVRKAFNRKWLSGLIGWVVVLTGIVSAATLAHAFIIYLNIFFHTNFYLTLFVVIVVLGVISIWGITESVSIIMLMTLIEIFGLLLIIYFGRASLKNLTQWQFFHLPNYQMWHGIFTGSFIAFYAYIGFEDMVNIAEETINPRVVLPIGIFLALAGATILYLVTSFVTTQTIPHQFLTKSNVPFIVIIKQQGHSPFFFWFIALIAIMNGIIVQMIMASRLIYGMARQQNAPKIFLQLNQYTQTPLVSTLLVISAILIFSYWLPIQTLAKITSTIILFVFIMIHISLIIIKLNNKSSKPKFAFPIIFPMIAILLSILFLLVQIL